VQTAEAVEWMSGYDGERFPSIAAAAATFIARQSPAHLITKLESLSVQLGDPELRTQYDDILSAFRGLQHRCDVALSRLAGEHADVDYAIALGGGEIQGRVLAPQYELICVVLQSMMGLADNWARDYYDVVPPVDAGPAARALSQAVLNDIGGYQQSVERLRSALDAFR
jgi:hypothetical protein